MKKIKSLIFQKNVLQTIIKHDSYKTIDQIKYKYEWRCYIPNNKIITLTLLI